MKKLAIGLVVTALVLVSVVVAFFVANKTKKLVQPSPTPKPKLSLPVNQIPLEERPFVTVEPTAAREVQLSIHSLPKVAESVDFELQYSAGDKEEAAIGSINLNGNPPYKKTILLGSQSGGGKITYHENVTGGTLVLTFYDPNYKLSQEWSYIDNRKPLTGFSSRDAKFQIETNNLFKGSAYVIVYNNPGLPAKVEETVLAGPYSVSGTTMIPNGKVTVSMRLTEEKPAEIMGWDGKAWKSYPTKMDGKTATATMDYAQTYIAVEK